jgi:hypothetical protein
MILDLLKRTVATAIKLPVAVAWDCISLGNMGEGASTTKLLREHQQRKELDEVLELARRLRANVKTQQLGGGK